MILLALALAAAPAPADVIGAGTESCGKWTAAAKENDWPRIVFRAWLGGFISAENLNVSGTVGNLDDGTDVPGMVAWVDNYCAANPLDLVDDAAVHLAVELIKRRKSR